MFGLRDFEGLKGFTLPTVTRSAAAVRFMNLVSRPPMFDGKACLLNIQSVLFTKQLESKRMFFLIGTPFPSRFVSNKPSKMSLIP